VSCTSPISFETLADLWSGDLHADETSAAEAHIFACDTCAAASERLGALVSALRGAIPPVISHARRDRLVEEGVRIHVTPVEAGTPTSATFAHDLDVLIHALRADLTGVEQVDVEILTPNGDLIIVLPHVPFDVARGEVLIACQRHYEYAFPGDPTFRLHSVTAGSRREIGSYLVRHHWR
jgi:hypothetical protein